MRGRLWLRGGLTVLVGGLGVGACTQLIGVESIPQSSPPAEGGKGQDAKSDRVMHEAAPGCDAGADACGPACTPKTQRCTPDGLGMQECTASGVWGAVEACPANGPVCLGTSCTCEPGAGQCIGSQFQRCVQVDAGAPPVWENVGAACDGTCTVSGCGALPPSCQGDAGGGQNDCLTGIDAGPINESCCTSYDVVGGTFKRGFDGYSTGFAVPTPALEATVSTFRLDRYEVTVGRFKRFVAALTGTGDAGADVTVPPWRPEPGSGTHTHLNAGQGLVNTTSAPSGGFETGWDPAWNAQLDSSTVKTNLKCSGGDLATWTGSTLSAAINCVDWAVAYAFCIWDGGFLPSEAEWNYAAAGGADQRIYPWSPSYAAQQASGSPTETIGCGYANYVPAAEQECVSSVAPVGSYSPTGDGKWGQADMAGNVAEWTLDGFLRPYASPCVDCANLGAAPGGGPDGGFIARIQRGGGFVSNASEVLASYRGYNFELDGATIAGFRCARVP